MAQPPSRRYPRGAWSWNPLLCVFPIWLRLRKEYDRICLQRAPHDRHRPMALSPTGEADLDQGRHPVATDDIDLESP